MHSLVTVTVNFFSPPDLQPRRARPREVGLRDGEGDGQGEASARGRVHAEGADRGHQRQCPRIRPSHLQRAHRAGELIGKTSYLRDNTT